MFRNLPNRHEFEPVTNTKFGDEDLQREEIRREAAEIDERMNAVRRRTENVTTKIGLSLPGQSPRPA